MNNNVHSALQGTKTQENLTDAFSGEARSCIRYRIFSKLAKESGDPVLADMLREMSDNELEHAELWLGYLGETDGNIKNLESLIASEDYESTVMYPEFAAEAKDEGFGEISKKMSYASNAEANHARMLADYLAAMKDGSLYSGDSDTLWVCTNCGYTHTGNTAPERCPLCSYPQKYYVKAQ